MRLGIVTNYYVPELGMNTYYLCRELSRVGVDVTLFASAKYGKKVPTEKYKKNEIDEPFKVIRVPTYFSAANIPFYNDLEKVLSEEHERQKFDLLQTEDSYQIYSNKVARFANKKNVPLILRHDLSVVPKGAYGIAFRFCEKYYAKYVVDNAKIGIVLNDACATYLHKLNANLKIVVVPFGVDTNEMRSGARRSYNIGYKRSHFGILTVARLIRGKGLVELFQALAIFNKHATNWHLNIIGKGPLKEYLILLAIQLNIANNINFISFVKHTDIAKFYQDCDVFVLPTYEEAGSLSVLEAMSCGRPVITTNIPEMNFIRDGIEGFIVPTKNAPVLADQIQYVYDNANKAENIGLNAQSLCTAYYSWSTIALRMKAIYESVLNGTSAGI